MLMPSSDLKLPFSVTPLPSLREGKLASVTGRGFRAELRRYNCETTREWAFNPSKPYISLTLRAGTMRRRGAYLLSSRRPELTDLGRLFLVPAATPLQVRFEPGVRDILACTFDPQELADLEDFTWAEETLPGTLDIRNSGARSALLRLVTELRSPGPATQLVTEAAVLLAAVELYRHFHVRRPMDARTPGPLAPWQLRRVTERIEGAPAASITLSQLADDCGISPRHLMRSFKAATGITVGAYLTEARISRAGDLLTVSAMPIKQIAHHCGFQSAAAFSTAYKRMTGMTPAESRRSGTALNA